MEDKSSVASEGEFSLHTAYIKDVTLTKLSYTFQKRRLWWKTRSHSRITFYSFIFTGVRYIFRRPLRVSPPEIETLTSSRLYSEESARCNKLFDCALWPLTLSEKRRSFSIQLFKLVCAAHELISDWVCVVISCLLTIQRFHQEMHLIHIFVTSCSFMNSVLHFPPGQNEKFTLNSSFISHDRCQQKNTHVTVRHRDAHETERLLREVREQMKSEARLIQSWLIAGVCRVSCRSFCSLSFS